MSGGHGRSRWSYFRLSPDWASTLVDRAGVEHGDTVLDLGAGAGALTGPLVDRGARVIALERHAGRVQRLRERFDGRSVSVVEADIRDLRLPARPFRVVANPPFHLARPIVADLLGARLLVRADLVLRHDTARNLARAHADDPRWVVETTLAIPRTAFEPSPSVDALVLTLRRRSGPGRAPRRRRRGSPSAGRRRSP
ncbi:ribosomal RNA adenine methylase transferase [Beutenbergia cavernae DSM 12333]|uniref:Ribosomal RNA adenine methylase transferase n=1 Tax=Beutenbergia cavernae (strain ATCC BAA-8 / DSM 12333 / CCUG 43141 / JCM 11478 / NBRC 16432 / NCIMB 13614 / HKI 0122) TaxID=471853 RepID=C5C5I8_BEUC1|nr:rRNA adenine N-6-methyltransferase family protein [Beutenbergia cavernae]ACQ80179.1 ribosomal RNA adenine methylase transferase [Beutenbergia cavernae DSM 12333]